MKRTENALCCRLRRVLALLCALCLLVPAGMADTIVIIDDIVYGSEAFDLHMADVPNTFTFGGEKYTFDGHWVDVEAHKLYGGNTRTLHEYTVPHKDYSVEDDGSQKLLATVSINPQKKATLRIANGNRISGEFIVSDPIVLTDLWVDEIYLPRDAQGHPVLVDRIYLYSYQEAGESVHYATGVYIEYENYAAQYALNDMITDMIDARTQDDETKVPVYYMGVTGELLAEGSVSALPGNTKTVTANPALVPGYDISGALSVDVTFAENGAVPEQVFFMCVPAAPTATPEPAAVIVPVYYLTAGGEILSTQTVKCFEGMETLIEADLSLVPDMVILNESSVQVAAAFGAATPAQVFFMCAPAPTATPVPTATPTAVPTATPTAVPTATPTAVPTATPTAVPTATPTAVPTATPTAVPTATPTAAPTATPTAVPSAEPVDMGDILFDPKSCDNETLYELNEDIKNELALRIAAVQESKPATEFLYASNGSEVRINAYVGAGGDVIFPDEIDGLPVTEIAKDAFSKQKLFTSVRLPRYLTKIGDSAFNYNYSLSGDLILPETLEKVDHKAFISDALTGLYIQSNCDISGVQTFAWLDKCKFLYIKDGCRVKMGSTTFSDSETMTEAIIPASVTEIADKAFEGSNRLVIYTPAGSYAEEYAKRNFIAVNTADYAQKAAFYAEKLAALNESHQIYSYTTPENAVVEAAGNESEMSDFTTQELSMISDMIARELTERGCDVFESTPLSEFLYASNGSEVRINAYVGAGGDVIFPDEIDGLPVTEIAKDAFSKQKLFTSVRLPRYLTKIGDSAFNYNYSLSGDLILPETLEKVDHKAFISDALTGLYIQSDCDISGVQTFAWLDECKFLYIKDGCRVKMGSTTFSDSETMTEAIIPASVTEIADKAFEGSNRLVIYTPAGSYAEEYAKRNFIRCDTENYALYEAYYSHLLNMERMAPLK